MCLVETPCLPRLLGNGGSVTQQLAARHCGNTREKGVERSLAEMWACRRYKCSQKYSLSSPLPAASLKLARAPLFAMPSFCATSHAPPQPSSAAHRIAVLNILAGPPALHDAYHLIRNGYTKDRQTAMHLKCTAEPRVLLVPFHPQLARLLGWAL